MLPKANVENLRHLPANKQRLTRGFVRKNLFPLHPHTKSVAIFEAPFYSHCNEQLEYGTVRIVEIFRAYRIEFYTSEYSYSRWWNTKKFQKKQDAVAYGLQALAKCQSEYFIPGDLAIDDDFLLCTTDDENPSFDADLWGVEFHSFLYKNWFFFQDLEADLADEDSAIYRLFDPLTNTEHIRNCFKCADDFVWLIENQRIPEPGYENSLLKMLELSC